MATSDDNLRNDLEGNRRDDPVRRTRFEREALRRLDRAGRMERSSILISGLLIAGALSVVVIAVLGSSLPDLGLRRRVIAAGATIILWLPVSWLLSAGSAWTAGRGRRGRPEKEFAKYLDLYYPVNDPGYRWENWNGDHPVHRRPWLRESALEGFAARAFHRWHFYLAVCLALVAWLYVIWLHAGDRGAMGADRADRLPTAALVFQVAAFAIAFAITRLGIWLVAKPTVPAIRRTWLIQAVAGWLARLLARSGAAMASAAGWIGSVIASPFVRRLIQDGAGWLARQLARTGAAMASAAGWIGSVIASRFVRRRTEETGTSDAAASPPSVNGEPHSPEVLVETEER
jgi:uncharacterized membrane protein YeaQ/YmgE (transglycosylase-associated protein family)